MSNWQGLAEATQLQALNLAGCALSTTDPPTKTLSGAGGVMGAAPGYLASASDYDIVADASPWTRLLPRPLSAAAAAAQAAAAVATGGVDGVGSPAVDGVVKPAPLHLLSRLEGLREVDLSNWEVMPEPGGE